MRKVVVLFVAYRAYGQSAPKHGLNYTQNRSRIDEKLLLHSIKAIHIQIGRMVPSSTNILNITGIGFYILADCN